jgi:predicted dehydrogenase
MAKKNADIELNIGVVGAGSFAEFAVQSFIQVDGISIVAVYDTDPVAASRFTKAFSAKSHPQYTSLLNDPNVHLVYIATPPYLHYSQSKAALLAGKHVICEKPAALRTAEAEELATLAGSKKLLYVVNLMQRYNPLVNVVSDIVENKILGNFLHGFFENYASDEKLTPDHWFWDEGKSGGIFIEHGVHFFDLFSAWLGKGEIIHAAQWQRTDTIQKIFDRVQATVNYPNGPVNFYHGFDQPKLLDRQELRLQFERGDVTLYEWIPVKIRLHGLLKKEHLEILKNNLTDCSIVDHSLSDTDKQKVMGRFHHLVFDQLITLESGHISDKQKRYEELLISMIRDQWNWIRDHSHNRVINEHNAVESIRMAETATILANQSFKHPL